MTVQRKIQLLIISWGAKSTLNNNSIPYKVEFMYRADLTVYTFFSDIFCIFILQKNQPVYMSSRIWIFLCNYIRFDSMVVHIVSIASKKSYQVK